MFNEQQEVARGSICSAH